MSASTGLAALPRRERQEVRHVVGEPEVRDGEQVEERGEVVLELPRARRHLVRLEQQARAAARGAVGHKRLEPLQHEEELPKA